MCYIYISDMKRFFKIYNFFGYNGVSCVMWGLPLWYSGFFYLWCVGARAHGLCSCGVRAELPQGIWDLSSLTRDWTAFTALEGRFLTTGPPGRSPDMWRFARQTQLLSIPWRTGLLPKWYQKIDLTNYLFFKFCFFISVGKFPTKLEIKRSILDLF